MGWVDGIICGLIVISALIGLVRGFVKEFISLASWVIAVVVALSYFSALAGLLEPYIESPTIRSGASFAILFVSSLIIGAIINFMISQMVERTGLSGTDKSLGVVFGMARGVLIVALLILLAKLTPMPSEQWWAESFMIEYFSDIADWIKSILPKDLLDRFSF